MNRENGSNFETQSGYTPLDLGRNLNWVASEVASGAKNGKYKIIGLQALYIHEVGNMIAKLLGMNFGADGKDNGKYKTGDPDMGQKLENCVFGGRVGLQTGRIGANRELK